MTGGTGFLGTLMSAKLIKEGHKIIYLGRTKEGMSIQDRIKDSLWNFDKSLNLDFIKILEANFSDKNLGLSIEQIKDLKDLNIDGIWHLAANLSFKKRNKYDVFSTNTYSLENVLDFARTINSPLLFTSTAYIHGQNTENLIEDNTPKPKKFNNPYEESKFEAEQIILQWAKRNKDNKFIIFRPALLIEREKSIFSLSGYYVVVASIYRLKKNLAVIKARYPIASKFFGIKKNNGILYVRFPFIYSKTGHLNLIPVDTAMDWMFEIINKPNSLNKTYHIVNPYPIKMKEVTEETFRAIGIKMPHFEVSPFVFDLYAKVIYFVSYFVKGFRGFAKKLSYYKFYMKENRIYDLSNSKRIGIEIHKEDFCLKMNYCIEKVARTFIKHLD